MWDFLARTDGLVDYKLTRSNSTTQKLRTEGSRGHKFKGRVSGVADGKMSGIVAALKGRDNMQQTSKWVGCLICQGPYQAKDYSKREKVFALQGERD